MTHNIPDQVRQEITQLISSEKSPVGIDAKETHIIIIHKLLQIEERLTAIEHEVRSGK